MLNFDMFLSVADPGFPRGGMPTPKGGGCPLFDQFSRKLYENEHILAQWEGVLPWPRL